MSEQHTNRVRASDAERERVAAALRDAMGEGRLSLAEGEERLAQVYATTYRDELAEFTADLPPYEAADQPTGETDSGAPGASRGPRRPRSSQRPRPVAGLVGILAVAAVIWAVAGSGPIWLAIVLGIVALSMAKHSGHGVHGHRPPGCARTDAWAGRGSGS